MGMGAILDRDVMENCCDNWHFSEELNDEMAGATHRFGNLAEETARVKALGPEKAWHVWGAARRPVHLRDSSGGSVPCRRADRQAYIEARRNPRRNEALLVWATCVAVGFLFCDRTLFIYLEPGQTGFPISMLLTSTEMSHFPIGSLALPVTGCQYR